MTDSPDRARKEAREIVASCIGEIGKNDHEAQALVDSFADALSRRDEEPKREWRRKVAAEIGLAYEKENADLKSRLSAAEERVEGQWAIINDYAMHTSLCDQYTTEGEKPCSCGLTKDINALSSPSLPSKRGETVDDALCNKCGQQYAPLCAICYDAEGVKRRELEREVLRMVKNVDPRVLGVELTNALVRLDAHEAGEGK